MRRPLFALAMSVAIAAAVSSFSQAANAFSITISVNENGNGTFTSTRPSFSLLPHAFVDDPGPGGLPNALTYSLLNPPGLAEGDVFLTEADGAISDVIRFNPLQNIPGIGTGTLVFYSDNVDGVDNPADGPGLPQDFYANTISIPEVGIEGNDGALYTPTAGQPGFVAGAAGPVTYDIISDSPIPLPPALPLFTSVVGGLALLQRWRKRQPVAP